MIPPPPPFPSPVRTPVALTLGLSLARRSHMTLSRPTPHATPAVQFVPAEAPRRPLLALVRGLSHAVSAVARPVRGVRLADYCVRGRPVLIAIDSAGNCVRRVRVMPNMDEEIVREWLWGYLERVDPAPLFIV
jgi:hypothetical protein